VTFLSVNSQTRQLARLTRESVVLSTGVAAAMPGTLSSAYACGCLNVRITPVPNCLPSPDLPVSTPDFNQVHVADEGISVVSLSFVSLRTMHSCPLIFFKDPPPGYSANPDARRVDVAQSTCALYVFDLSYMPGAGLSCPSDRLSRRRRSGRSSYAHGRLG
jgi:hypothetical protein